MFQLDQRVRITTALGGVQVANYKGPLPVLPGTHEVWVGNRPSASRIVRTDQIESIRLIGTPR